MRKGEKSGKVGAPLKYTNQMLEHDIKMFLKRNTVDKANPSSLEKFSCDKENVKKLGTHSIGRATWIRRYKQMIEDLKKPTGLVVNNDGNILMYPSAYTMVNELSEAELITAIQRLINVCMSLSKDVQAFEELKIAHKKINEEKKQLTINIHGLKDYVRELEGMVREEALDSLNQTRREELGLPNRLDMRLRVNAEKGCSGNFAKHFPGLWEAANDDDCISEE